MIKIHTFDLLYKLWYRGSFYKNPKVRHFFVSPYHDKTDKWGGIHGTVECGILLLWLANAELIILICIDEYCYWHSSTVAWMKFMTVILTLVASALLWTFCKDKNWYFNKEKLQELNEELRGENVIWPIRVLCWIMFFILCILIIFLPAIIFFGIYILSR